MPGPEAAPGITRVASTQNISTPACTLQHYTSHHTLQLQSLQYTQYYAVGVMNKPHYVDLISYQPRQLDTGVKSASTTRVRASEYFQDIYINNCVYVNIELRKLAKHCQNKMFSCELAF